MSMSCDAVPIHAGVKLAYDTGALQAHQIDGEQAGASTGGWGPCLFLSGSAPAATGLRADRVYHKPNFNVLVVKSAPISRNCHYLPPSGGERKVIGLLKQLW